MLGIGDQAVDHSFPSLCRSPCSQCDRDALQMLAVPKPRIELAGEIVDVKIHVGAPFKVLELLASLYHKRAGKSRAGCGLTTENMPPSRRFRGLDKFDKI